jgi:hypothetical protein
MQALAESSARWRFFAVCLLLAGQVAAQDEAETPATLPVETSAVDKPGAPAVQEPGSGMKSDPLKKRKATAGLAAVGGIAILGISIIAVTMLWARRLRRLARDRGPLQKTEGDDFWFLKPPKQIANESDVARAPGPKFPPTAEPSE